MNSKAGDALDVGFELVVQLALIAGLCVGAAWLWPDGLLSRPLASLSLLDVLRAASAVGIGALTLAWIYFLLVEPIYSASAR